jgi:hypothetical protein
MRTHWRTVLGVSFVVALVTQTSSVLLQGLKPGNNSTGPALLIGLLGLVVATAMLTMVTSRAVLGRPVTARETWSDARPQLLRLLGLLLLLALMCAGIAAIGIAPGITIALGGSSTPGVGLALFGGVAAAAVVVWLMIRYYLAVPALMLEKQGVRKSLSRSAKLVRGSWWRVFGIQLLVGLLVLVVSGMIELPFVIAAGMTDPGGFSAFTSGTTVPFGWSYLIITGIGGAIASTITLPISAGATVLLYIDQRIRREALDIELARAAGVPGFAGADGNTAGV